MRPWRELVKKGARERWFWGCRAGGRGGLLAPEKSPNAQIDGFAGFAAPDLVPMNIKNEAEG